MYFITKRDSKTGEKFADIEIRRKECFEAQKKVASKYGFNQWRSKFHCVFGGISSTIFKENPDVKLWKKDKFGEWMPRLNIKEGKAIKNEFDQLPNVQRQELNACIGFDEYHGCIGFAINNDTYFGFSIDQSWKLRIPKDCKEVTLTRYNQLFPDKK